MTSERGKRPERADAADSAETPGASASGGGTRSGGKAGARAWFWARLLAVAVILWYVVEKNGRGRILETLLSADPAWVAAAALVFFLSILLGAYQWYLLLRFQGIDYPYRACFRTYYSGMFLNNFLPGTVGGDALRIYEVHKAADALGKSVAATFLDRLIGFFSLSLMSLLAVAVTLWRGALDESVLRHLLYAVGVVFACFVLVLSLLLSRRLSSLAHVGIRWTGMKWLEDAYAKIQETLRAYHARRRQMAFVVLVSCGVQFLRIDVHWLSSIGLGADVDAVFFFTFIPIIALAGVIPINVGGWGVPQSLGTYLYTLPGVIGAATADPKAAAVALAFLPSVVGLVVMLGGGFYFVSGKPRDKRA
jgi:uncharacterized protein (TIRG00374 family)